MALVRYFRSRIPLGQMSFLHAKAHFVFSCFVMVQSFLGSQPFLRFWLRRLESQSYLLCAQHVRKLLGRASSPMSWGFFRQLRRPCILTAQRRSRLRSKEVSRAGPRQSTIATTSCATISTAASCNCIVSLGLSSLLTSERRRAPFQRLTGCASQFMVTLQFKFDATIASKLRGGAQYFDSAINV